MHKQSLQSHRFLTAPEICETLRISRRQLGRMIVDRKLAYVRVGGVLRFPVTDVERFINVRTVKAAA
jgi:excisionase family DNA binding protein